MFGFASFWKQLLSAALPQVLHDGNNGTSVVQFTNLLMFEGRFIYIYAGVIAKKLGKILVTNGICRMKSYAFFSRLSLWLSFVQALGSFKHLLCRNPTNSPRHVCLLGLGNQV